MHLRSVRLLHDTFPVRDRYPFSLGVFQETGALTFQSPVSFFIGENGTGKSTLLRAIADACSIHVWDRWEGRRDAANPFEDQLHKSLRIEWTRGKVTGSFFAAEIFRHFAEALDGWSAADPGCLRFFGGDSLIVKSHGQSHMAFFTHRFAREGLYLLDEPENALSPVRQIELVRALQRFAARGDTQFIIATHSPILLALPGAEIFSFDNSPIRKVAYEETDYYRVYRDFLDDRRKYLDPP